jgi:hypothetical protein
MAVLGAGQPSAVDRWHRQDREIAPRAFASASSADVSCFSPSASRAQKRAHRRSAFDMLKKNGMPFSFPCTPSSLGGRKKRRGEVKGGRIPARTAATVDARCPFPPIRPSDAMTRQRLQYDGRKIFGGRARECANMMSSFALHLQKKKQDRKDRAKITFF